MGRRKARLSRRVKNYERKQTGRRSVGRPPKRKAPAPSPPTPTPPDLSSAVSSPNLIAPTPSSTLSSSLTPSSTLLTLAPVSTPSSTPPGLIPSPTPPPSILSDLDLPERWVIQNQKEDKIGICKISSQPSTSTGSLVITHCIIVNRDLTWNVSIHGCLLDATKCSVLSKVPSTICTDSLQSLVLLLDQCTVCPGHPDAQFVQMVEAKKGKLMSKDGKSITARVDDFSTVYLNGDAYSKTVRASKCEILVHGSKCPSCVSYRDSLRRIYHRWLKQKSPSRQSSKSRVNVRWLNTPEKSSRYSQLRTRLDAKNKEVKRLQDKISYLTKQNGILLESNLESDFKDIMNEMTNKVHTECPEGSFKRIFWDQQLKAANIKDRKQIRWHPAIIKWCLHLKFISSGAYHALRESGMITLPSERTLRDYTHWMPAKVGFMPEVDTQLVKEANISEEKDRYVVLCWDEVKIKETLIFDKHTCELVGFTNVGDINNHLDRVQEQCESEQNSRVHTNVATHMLLFMVRGMFTSLEFPYAHFATRGATADALYPLVWEVVQRLERCGLNVIAFSCDGASPNRKFYKMHASSSDGVVHKTRNPFCEDRYIYFICDVPHLMKTTRNCWSNSFAHKNSRALWVLSTSVANAMEYFGDEETVETRKFIRHFDRFFDCMNVRCTSEGIHKRKPDLRPYRDPSDPRLSWLKDGFLKYLQDWEDCVHSREGFSKAEAQKMQLSKETIEGLRITVLSFIEMAQYLLSLPGVQYILSEKLCQDPIEAFFGKQRAAGGRSDNPTVQQFCQNTVSLRVQGLAAMEPIRGNCGKRERCASDADSLSDPLPKRPRRAKH